MGFGEENRWRLSFPGSPGVIKFKHTLKYVKKNNSRFTDRYWEQSLLEKRKF